MSAFAALQSESVASLLEAESVDESDAIAYERNSSDLAPSDDDDDGGAATAAAAAVAAVAPLAALRRPNAVVTQSNFVPTKDNFIVLTPAAERPLLLIGLKQGEYIIVNGQFELAIERGACLINNCHYEFAHPDRRHRVVASQLQALPMIASTQVRDRLCGIVDTRRVENEHLFHSDYKSVVVLRGFETGLERIGAYYPPLKHFMYNRLGDADEDEPADPAVLRHHPDVALLRTLPFEVVFDDERGVTGLCLDKAWTATVHEIAQAATPTVTMVIGSKNSGKSTLSRSLCNCLLTNGTVAYLDLDPGQSEYSTPYCLSITTHTEPVFGLYTRTDTAEEAYYGFTTPQLLPQLYLAAVQRLWRHWCRHMRPRGHHLVINTPGWIKGLGKDLLEEITMLTQPQHLVYLTAQGIVEEDPVLELLSYDRLHVLPGMYQLSRYSPALLRNFSKLAYLHRTVTGFEFESHILQRPPVKVSFQTSPASSFHGVNAVRVLNHDTPLHFEHDDLLLMLDASIVGVYLVDHETFLQHQPSLACSEGLPLYMGSAQYDDLTATARFMGLCVVHSINHTERYFNLYFPCGADAIKQQIVEGQKLILVKGDGDLPSPEILMPALVQRQLGALKRLRKHLEETPPQMPYVDFVGGKRIGGVWKIRRNIMRRGHR
jgi:polynucleotide 5'-hydroxyl-kinase GRC3/NOL9